MLLIDVFDFAAAGYNSALRKTSWKGFFKTSWNVHCSLREKFPYSEFFWSAPYLSEFSPNPGKHGSEKLCYVFHVVHDSISIRYNSNALFKWNPYKSFRALVE